MPSRNPRLIAPMSFLAALSLPASSEWGTALAGHVVTQPRYKQQSEQHPMSAIEHLNQFDVIELRRYTVTEGKRQHFATYFENFFPEAFQQLGAIVFGSCFERGNNRFTWLRGFRDINARAIVNSSFYYGPLWREHRNTMNEILPDSDNVLLLRPIHVQHAITMLPAVDPVIETAGAQGVLVAQIFSIKHGAVDAFAQQAETQFAHYRAAGIREAGIMVSLDVPNNFPQLPVRTDGPYLVWLGIVENDQALQSDFDPLEKAGRRFFIDTGLLRGLPELVIMDPTPRSRLRWYAPQCSEDTV